MKKLCLLALAAVLALLSPVGCSRAADGIDARATVRLLEDEENIGSAVVLLPGVVLTAQHVMVAAPKAKIGAGQAPASVIAITDGDLVDLALVAYPVAEAPCPCARLADYPARLDEPIYTIGHPGSRTQIVALGTAQGTHDINQPGFHGRRLVATAWVSGGNSGGGVFVKRDGEYQLVGVLTEGNATRHLSYAIPLEEIRAFINEFIDGSR